MSIIAIIGVIILASWLDKAVKRQKARQEALAKQMAKEREAQRKINERLSKEQQRQEKAQAAAWERQRKEDARRDAQLAKHEEEIRKMQFQLEQANADIEHWDSAFYELCGMLDYLKMEQSGTTPGGKEWSKYQNKIISLENRIHTTEARLAKAKHAKAEAERKLA